MQSVSEYLDYRKFLKDFYAAKKEQLPFFSYRVFARKTGIDYSILIRIVGGSLHISPKKLKGLIRGLELSEKEAEYFENLVQFNKAKTEKECKLYFEKLLNLKSFKQNTLIHRQYEFFSKWYYSGLWSILHHRPFKGKMSELGQKLEPALSAKQVRDALDLLESINLVQKDKNGQWSAVGTNVTTGEEWHSLAIREYQKAMIRLSEESLDRFPKNQRDVSTITINIPREKLPEYSEYIAEFRRSMIKLAASHTESDSVYQLNMQFFPLTSEKEQ